MPQFAPTPSVQSPSAWARTRLAVAAYGARLVAIINDQTGGVARFQHDKNAELVTSDDFSAMGSRSVFVGMTNSNYNASVGVENTAVGADCLTDNTTGYANVAIGVDVLPRNTTGAFNTAVGVKALYKNTTGMGNTAFGAYSMYQNFTGNANTSYGEDSNRYVNGGHENVAVGTQSLYNNVTGAGNTAVGTYAARNATNPPDDDEGTGPSPTFITAVGALALYSATGSLNVGVGHSAGYSFTGSNNTAVGGQAGYPVTSGEANVFVGHDAGNVTGQGAAVARTVAVGERARTTGPDAVAVGSRADGADSGVAVGVLSVTGIAGTAFGATAEAGADGVAVGFNAEAGANGIAIGRDVTAAANVAVIGNSSQTAVYHYGDILPQTANSQDIGTQSAAYGAVWANTVITLPVLVASLPSAAAVGAGARAMVTNCNSSTFGAVVAGGGVNVVPVYSDGGGWRVG